MRHISIALFFICINFIMAEAQDARKIFTDEKIVFYGVDFSKAKITMPDAKPTELKSNWFVTWNNMIVTDNEWFNKESAFQKLKVPNDPTTVERRNGDIKLGDMQLSPEATLSKSDIDQVISDYKDGIRKEGVGFVFLVESMSKKKGEVVAHATFFDIATRKVLLTKKMVESPSGPGLKNYWSHPFHLMFEKMTNGVFDTWRKEVMGK